MTYELTNINFDPRNPLKYELTTMTPVISGASSEIQSTDWIIYPFANHDLGGCWGSATGSIVFMKFDVTISDNTQDTA